MDIPVKLPLGLAVIPQRRRGISQPLPPTGSAQQLVLHLLSMMGLESVALPLLPLPPPPQKWPWLNWALLLLLLLQLLPLMVFWTLMQTRMILTILFHPTQVVEKSRSKIHYPSLWLLVPRHQSRHQKINNQNHVFVGGIIAHFPALAKCL